MKNSFLVWAGFLMMCFSLLAVANDFKITISGKPVQLTAEGPNYKLGSPNDKLIPIVVGGYTYYYVTLSNTDSICFESAPASLGLTNPQPINIVTDETIKQVTCFSIAANQILLSK